MIEQQDRNDGRGDDWLEQALIAAGREHRSQYVSDDGFTARVMTTMPAPATLPAWRMPVVLVLWAAAAAAIAVLLPELTAEIVGSMLRLFASYPVSLSGIAVGVVMLAIATWAAAAMVLRDD